MIVAKAFRALRDLCADHRGASAVEYGLIVAVVMLAILAGLSQLGIGLRDTLNAIAAHLGTSG